LLGAKNKMPRFSNREIEEHYFKMFSGHYPLPEGRIEYADQPDVIIHNAQKLGIEIANLYLLDGSNEASEQVQRNLRDTVLQQAQLLYESRTDKKFELTVSFDPQNPVHDSRSVASKLADLAISLESTNGGFFVGEATKDIKEINSVYRSEKECMDSKWRTCQVYSGQYLDIERLKKTIDTKNLKLPYYQCCDAFWLLLIVDAMDRAQDQEISWPKGSPPLDSKFNKIVIYKPQFATFLDVPIRYIGG
jgi:hypothetical protein